ncbi:MAG: hypothetical protein K6E91_08050 [Butyrivibrio sp.]|nr:hypothetical protein [Butyrivibrio sp.]
MEKSNSKAKINVKRRHKGTFIVKLDDCQHGTWQGKVVWAEENVTEYFRSALELIKLIDEAVNASEAGGSLEQDSRVSAS